MSVIRYRSVANIWTRTMRTCGLNLPYIATNSPNVAAIDIALECAIPCAVFSYIYLFVSCWLIEYGILFLKMFQTNKKWKTHAISFPNASIYNRLQDYKNITWHKRKCRCVCWIRTWVGVMWTVILILLVSGSSIFPMRKDYVQR